MMQLKNKKIGIWGFGITGKAIARFLLSKGYSFEIMDQQEPNLDSFSSAEKTNMTICSEKEKNQFLARNDITLDASKQELYDYSKRQR